MMRCFQDEETEKKKEESEKKMEETNVLSKAVTGSKSNAHYDEIFSELEKQYNNSIRRKEEGNRSGLG